MAQAVLKGRLRRKDWPRRHADALRQGGPVNGQCIDAFRHFQLQEIAALGTGRLAALGEIARHSLHELGLPACQGTPEQSQVAIIIAF
jgi:hypothetical protein